MYAVKLVKGKGSLLNVPVGMMWITLLPDAAKVLSPLVLEPRPASQDMNQVYTKRGVHSVELLVKFCTCKPPYKLLPFNYNAAIGSVGQIIELNGGCIIISTIS